MRFAVHGASGRMGRAIVRLLHEAGDAELVGAMCAPDDPSLGRDAGELAGVGSIGVLLSADIGSSLLGADAVIDFSGAPAVAAIARATARAKVPLVSGTTGIREDGQVALDEAARVVPVLWAPNMSLGIEVVAALARLAIERLGPSFDVEIVETHHRAKVDAPSGTAKRLAEAARDARADLIARSGRDGLVGPRRDDEMAVLALRGGDVIGDHTIHLLGLGERIEITHRATSRDLFAHGAIRAARWVCGRAPGRYALRDLVVSP